FEFHDRLAPIIHNVFQLPQCTLELVGPMNPNPFWEAPNRSAARASSHPPLSREIRTVAWLFSILNGIGAVLMIEVAKHANGALSFVIIPRLLTELRRNVVEELIDRVTGFAPVLIHVRSVERI